jgi:hypothetical protein
MIAAKINAKGIAKKVYPIIFRIVRNMSISFSILVLTYYLFA